jgi:glutamine synthetase
LEFLLAVAAVLKGTDTHGALIRWCISGSSNDHRLGGHEAPPAIISLYLGSHLEGIVDALGNNRSYTPEPTRHIDLGIPYLPLLEADSSDRNRTSPFAFTGNKFEVRAVGSSQQASASNTVLNVILADSFRSMEADVRARVANGEHPKDAALNVVKAIFKQHRRIIFSGNGYSNEWRAEAKKRGLPNLVATPDVLDVVSESKQAKELFSSLGVLSNEEFDARNTVMYEEYCNNINIEAHLLKKMSRQFILPASLKTNNLLHNSGVATGGLGTMYITLSGQISRAYEQTETLSKTANSANKIDDVKQKARFALEQTIPAMNKLRETLDDIEGRVDRRDWPFATYSELLFHKH